LMKWKMIEIGVEDPMKYMTPGGVDKIVIAALPHQEQYVKQFGAAGHYHLIEELEERFLTEMNNMLEGKSSDAATVAIVDNVLKEVGEVQRKAQEAAAKAVETET
jgi:RNase H-fold protein (predicted Holliday junction resolvase)